MTAPTSAGPLRIALLGDPNSVHMHRWAATFAELGHEIHFVVPDTDAVTKPLDPRFTVHRFAAWPRSYPKGVRILVTSRSLRKILREIDADVLHSQSVTRYGLAAWLARFHPYVVTVWGSDVLIAPKTSRRLRITTWLSLHGADLVTGGSEYLVRAAIAAGARRDRTRYIHFGIDTERFSPGSGLALRDRLGLPPGRIVLSSRAVAPLYRQRVVVDAFATLPDDTLLLMTNHGADADELEAVRRRAAELGVADRLHIVPAVSEAEVADLYRLADAVVSIPISDGGPNTVVEALACGKPIVASDLPPNREWLGELDPAALVPVDDAAATGRALNEVLARAEAEREERSARGREAVVAHADRGVTMGLMESLYRELAARRRHR